MERTASSATTRDIYMKKISANPKWRDTTKSGNGFVIGGGKLPSGKKAEIENPTAPNGCANVADLAAEKDPPYLAELIAEVMAAHPGLTKDQAREMLLASGA
jgi:hypothetical protein